MHSRCKARPVVVSAGGGGISRSARFCKEVKRVDTASVHILSTLGGNTFGITLKIFLKP